MNLTEAQHRAEELRALILPFCERVEIAGSIRRGKLSDIKDLELVAVTKIEERFNAGAMFTDAGLMQTSLLHEWAASADCPVQWIKTGTSEIIPWAVKPDAKWLKAALDGDIKLDLFITTPEGFGIQMVIRTGCADFSKAFVVHARDVAKKPSREGYLRQGEGGPIIPTPREEDVFRELGLAWVDPEHRTSAAAVRRLSARATQPSRETSAGRPNRQRTQSPSARQEPRGGVHGDGGHHPAGDAQFLDHLEAEGIIRRETLALARSLGCPSECCGHTALGEATWGYLVTSNASIAEVRKIRAELERIWAERERMLCQ